VRKSRTPGSVRGYPVTGIPTATFEVCAMEFIRPTELREIIALRFSVT
jgi:hypothetical protein